MSSQAPNATRRFLRRFPRQHVVQADQKLRLKNLLQVWKAKTLKHGQSSMATIAEEYQRISYLSLLSRKR